MDEVVQTIVLTLLGAYRALISPWLGPACRFSPSCSEYASESVRKHGVFKGLWKALGRLARCQSFHPGGADPVA